MNPKVHTALQMHINRYLSTLKSVHILQQFYLLQAADTLLSLLLPFSEYHQLIPTITVSSHVLWKSTENSFILYFRVLRISQLEPP